jgi:hypothetical protein
LFSDPVAIGNRTGVTLVSDLILTFAYSNYTICANRI